MSLILRLAVMIKICNVMPGANLAGGAAARVDVLRRSLAETVSSFLYGVLCSLPPRAQLARI